MSEIGGVDGERDLPAGWAWVKLDQVCDVSGGIQKQAKRRPVQNKFPFLRVANVGRGSMDLTEVHEVELFDGELDRFRLRSGDLLVVEGNGSPDQIGRAAMWTSSIKDAVHQNHLIRVRPTSAIDPKFLELLWNSPAISDQLLAVAQSTSGLYTLSTSKLKRVEFALPPLDEQYRIVEALEEQLSRLDAAVSAVLRTQRRQARLIGAVRDRLVHAEGELPVGWSWLSLRDVVDRVEAGKSFRCEPRPATDDEWGVVKVSAMTWGEFRQEEQKAVPLGREVDGRHEIMVGDILVSRANTPEYVGAPVLVRKTRPRLLMSDKSLRLVPVRGVSRDWLITVLSAPLVRQQITAKATGSKDSMRNISQRDLLSVRIPVPPAEEQSRLAERADEVLSGIEGMAREAERVLRQATALRRAILRRAFSGRLVRQKPGEEPASALLTCIATERAAQSKPKRMHKAPAQRATESAPEPTPAPALAVQQEFDL